MAFTSILGTTDAQLANIILGSVGVSPPPPPAPTDAQARLGPQHPLRLASGLPFTRLAALPVISPNALVLYLPTDSTPPPGQAAANASARQPQPVPFNPQFLPGPWQHRPFVTTIIEQRWNHTAAIAPPVRQVEVLTFPTHAIIRGPWNRFGLDLPHFGNSYGNAPVPPPPFIPPLPPPPQSGVFGISREKVPAFPRAPEYTENRLRQFVDKVATLLNSLSRKGFIRQDENGEWEVIGGGFELPRAPVPTDDKTLGALVGSTYVDTLNNAIYICVNNSVGSAVWQLIPTSPPSPPSPPPPPSPPAGGTVTSFAFTNANGVSGTVLTPTTTPTLSITLGAITPSSVNGVTFSGTGTLANSGTVSLTNFTGSGSSSGSNTGDQTSVSGNAGTATALQTARTINGVSFDGTANITVAAAASTLTGTTLASGVVTSSLTSVGTLTAGATGAGFTVAFSTSTLTGTIGTANLPGGNWITGTVIAEDVLSVAFGITSSATWQAVTDGGGNVEISLTAGTWDIRYSARGIAVGTGGSGNISVMLKNVTDGTDVANSELLLTRITSVVTENAGSASHTVQYTVASGTKVIRMYAWRDTGPTYTTSNISSNATGRTTLSAVRTS